MPQAVERRAGLRGAAATGEVGLQPERRQVPCTPQGQGLRRRYFLQNKGLTTDEMDESSRRVPDPPTTTTFPSTQTQSPAPAAAPPQAYTPAAGPIIATPYPRLTWYRAFVVAGSCKALEPAPLSSSSLRSRTTGLRRRSQKHRRQLSFCSS